MGNDAELKRDILKLFHSSALGGYSGVTITMQKISLLEGNQETSQGVHSVLRGLPA